MDSYTISVGKFFNDKVCLLVQTLGNLSLLTESLNPSVSNGPWTKKRSAILTHSALCLNRALPEGEWAEAQISDRAATMFETAMQAWPRPTKTKG